MGKKVLTQRQEKVLKAVAREPKLAHFYLSGGTALAAFYLKHRLSDDLDFFTMEPPDTIFLDHFMQTLKKSLKAKEIHYEKLYDRRLFTLKWTKEVLKVEFTIYPFPQFKKPQVKGGVRIDSLRDISANKLMALLDRFEPKDFVDLFFLLKERRLEDLVCDTEKKFGIKIDPLFLGGEFSKARRISALPPMLKRLSVGQLKKFFTRKALELRPRIL